MKKWIIRLLLTGMVLVVGLFVTVYLLRDWIARKGIEEGGSHALGVTVTCAKVDSHPFSGSVKIDGTVVGNPPGFKAPSLLSLSSLTVDAEPMSLFKDEIKVKEIIVDRPTLTIERSGLTTNIGALLDNIQGKSDTKTGDEKGVEKKKYRIASLKIKDASVKFMFVNGLSYEEKIPLIELTDVGPDSTGGTSTAKLIGVILYALAEAAVGGAKGVPKDFLRLVSRDLAGAANGIESQASKSFEQLKKTTGGLTDGIKDIFILPGK